MAAKAYLMMHVDVALFPPEIVGATITSEPLTGLTLVPTMMGRRRWIELCHTKAGDFSQAQDKLLAMIEGTQHCPFGDLRFLWPYLDPSEEAHRKRFYLDQYIKKHVEPLSADDVQSWAAGKVNAERGA